MSVTTLYSNKTGYLFEGRVFKYTAGTEVIGEKGIRIDPRGFIRGGGGPVRIFRVVEKTIIQNIVVKHLETSLDIRIVYKDFN